MSNQNCVCKGAGCSQCDTKYQQQGVVSNTPDITQNLLNQQREADRRREAEEQRLAEERRQQQQGQ